ncbi:MAG TPA: M1 family metallopeptidase, partial [Puia sp.]|nr:M1 family metallopeptidase [Puia sp.]
MKPFLPLLLLFATLARAQNKETADTLRGLAGSYRNPIDPSLQFNIKREKDQLIFEVPGQGQTPMTGLGNDRFRPKQVNPPAIVAFVRDSTGNVGRFRWIQNHKGSNGEWLCDSASTGLGGRYQLKHDPYKIIRIRERDGRLTSQLNAGMVFDLQPDGPNKYLLKTGDYTIRYEFVPAGKKYRLLTRESGDFEFFRFNDAAAGVVDKGFPPDRSFDRADTLRGMLTPLRTCYDVSFYDLDIAVDPAARSIQGSATIRFRTLQTFSRMQIDLFANMTIEKILFHGAALAYTREFNAVFIDFPRPVQQGANEAITIVYAGTPQVPDISVLKGGFIWFSDKQGNPWIESVCQGSGASLWWPCKDHLSDKPDSMKISITVPAGLTDISNGRLLDSVALPDHHTRFDWYVDYPIPNYDVVVTIGRYVTIADTLIRDHDTLKLHYYCIQNNEDKANRIFALVKPMLRLYEKNFGEYPFQKDGFTLMESLYGMEHQGAVSFGPVNSPVNSDHFDFADLSRVAWHESAHEWWGNSITCKDMADMWIHEAFATYAEVLSYENFAGTAAAKKYLKEQIPGNKRPIIG